MSTLKYWIWLSSMPALKAYTAKNLLDRFGSPEQVYFADEKAYAQLQNLGRSELDSLLRKNLTEARKILDSCEENGFRILTLQDASYPARLRYIPDPPLVLYVRGRLPVLDEEAPIGVVGTRNCTPYGLRASEKIGYELARHGCLVVTGLARGIDSAAAKGALRAGGRVIGVVGSGLNIIYPPENRLLFDDVAQTGAIISEYAPGAPAASSHFPQRNRIISGISVGVTVIEAPHKSGALITAAHALDQGRDVFALPGNIDSPACEGSNKLLREGAVLVTSGLEIAEEYTALYPDKIKLQSKKVALDKALEQKLLSSAEGKIRQNPSKKEIDNDNTVEYIDLVKLKEQLNDDEFKILSSIGPGTLHIDEIILETRLDVPVVLAALTMLELDGLVEQMTGKYFKLIYEREPKERI